MWMYRAAAPYRNRYDSMIQHADPFFLVYILPPNLPWMCRAAAPLSNEYDSTPPCIISCLAQF